MRLICIILCVILPTILWADTHVYTSTQNLSTGGSIPGAPTDGDAIVITDGDITMDLAMTGSGLIASTITAPGQLIAPTTPGTYTLRSSGGFSGTGRLYFVGPSDGDVPNDVNISVISTYSGSVFNLSGANVVRCTDPTIPMATLKANYNSGILKIYVHETLDADWVAGKVIRLDNVMQGGQSTEYIIANVGVDGGGQYITLTTGLTIAVAHESSVFLAARNVKFTGNKSTGQTCFTNCPGSFIKAEIRNFVNGVNATSGITIVGGLWVNNTYIAFNTTNIFGSDAIFTGNQWGETTCSYGEYVNCVWSGGSYGLANSFANTITGSTFCGCTSGLSISHSNTLINCTLRGGASVISSSFGNSFYNTTFRNNIRACVNSHNNNYLSCTWIYNSIATLDASFNDYISNSIVHSDAGSALWQNGAASVSNNTQFVHGHTYAVCDYTKQGVLNYNESKNENGDPRGYHAHTLGGTVNSDLTEFPDGHDFSYRHNPISDIYPDYWQFSQQLTVGQRLGVIIHYKCDSTGWAIKPKFEIIDKCHDPLALDTEEALATFVVDDSDTYWHTAQLQYANTEGTQVQDIVVRATAQDASKIFYNRMDVIYPGTVGVRSCGN